MPKLSMNSDDGNESYGAHYFRSVSRHLINDCSRHLARRALSIIAPCLREEEHRDAYIEFAKAFSDVLLWYETERERIARRVTFERDPAGGPPSSTDAPEAEE